MKRSENNGKRKEPFLFNGSLDYTGSQAFGADVKFARLTAANINADSLNVDEPAASRMTV